MEKNIWGNYFGFINPESASSTEINAWLQNTMEYMDDFVSFSKKVCEMKATPDDIMLLWENSSRKIQSSVSDCMKMLGFPEKAEDTSKTDEKIKDIESKLEAAKKSIEDYKKKIKDKESEISAQKKNNDKLSQLLADQKKEITKLQLTISSLEEAAVKAAAPKTSQ